MPRRSIALLFVASLLAGCGSGASNGMASRSGAEVVAAAAAAVRETNSVRVESSYRTEREEVPFESDARLSVDEGVARVSYADRAIDLRRIGTRLYLKLPGDLFATGEATRDAIAAEVLADRWLVASSDGNVVFGYLAFHVPSLHVFFQRLLAGNGRRFENEGEVSLDGRRAIALRDPDDDVVLYVSATGVPLPLQLSPSDGRGQITFRDWNEPLEIDVPGDALEPSGAQTTALAQAVFEQWLPDEVSEAFFR
jgi:hypothetical protein